MNRHQMYISYKEQIITIELVQKWERYLPFPLPILNSLLHHSPRNNDNKRDNSTDGRIRSEWSEGQSANDKEIKIGHPPELLKQGLGKETCCCVLCAPHIVTDMVMNHSLKIPRFIAMNHPWKTRSPNLWMIILKRWSSTSEWVDLTKMEFPPPASFHFSLFN